MICLFGETRTQNSSQINKWRPNLYAIVQVRYRYQTPARALCAVSGRATQPEIGSVPIPKRS